MLIIILKKILCSIVACHGDTSLYVLLWAIFFANDNNHNVYVKLLASGMQHCIVNFTTSIIMIYYIFMIMSLLKSLLMCTHLFITTNFSRNDGLIVLIFAFMTDKQIALNCHFLMWIVNDGRWQGIILFSFHYVEGNMCRQECIFIVGVVKNTLNRCFLQQ